jgi:hypothetical protein
MRDIGTNGDEEQRCRQWHTDDDREDGVAGEPGAAGHYDGRDDRRGG